MKNILILGGFGFIGTNIIKYIDENLFGKYSVIVFDKYQDHPQNIKFKSIIQVYAGDFLDISFMDKIFSENKIDIVIHSLSTTIPTLSINARYDIETNLIPTVELLNTMVKYNVKDIVYISSGGAVYGNSSNYLHKESDDIYPISSYGVVKLATEKYLFQYSSLFHLKPLVLRLSNPYGKFHFSMKQGICNVALQSALQNIKFKVWGDGNAKKDYIFIEDFVDLLFKLLDKNITNEVLNIGSGDALSVNEILRFIAQRIPKFSWHYSEASKYDVTHFELDTSKLRDIIGDYKFTSIHEGLQRTIDWLKIEQ